MRTKTAAIFTYSGTYFKAITVLIPVPDIVHPRDFDQFGKLHHPLIVATSERADHIIDRAARHVLRHVWQV